jgi:MoaA/NifB/PqqE/SkfB family radical SAM enzyme
MSLSPELQKAYEDAYPLFLQSANVDEAKAKSWRYFLEINSACQLKCPTCTKGNMAGYDHQTGIMDIGLMGRILDKIASENPKAVVCMYGNSEPFLHPKLPWCIAAIKKRGLHAQFSTNLNYVHHLDETLAANPNVIIISLSGFTQEVYVKGHAGGNIEKVKANMKLVSEANAKAKQRVNIWVTYHIYNDNAHELPLMREYATGLGFMFIPATARAISMENAIQYCRSKDPDAKPFEVDEGQPDWNKILPPVGDTYIAAMERLKIPPTNAREMYKDYPVDPVCPVGAGSMFTFIRHDGQTSLCACVADRRLRLGDYLNTTPDQLIEQRTGHSFCKQCLHYRTNMYFHLVDREKWGP